MSAATATRPVPLLRYALLLAVFLPVLLGLFGMHVLAGSHGMHAQVAPAANTAASMMLLSDAQVHASPAPDGHAPSASAGQAHSGPSATPASAAIGGPEVPPSCVCQGGCAEKPTVHAGCTPSPAGASLSAPQPGSTSLDGGSWTAARAESPAGYTYVPGTPTPRDLSISRT